MEDILVPVILFASLASVAIYALYTKHKRRQQELAIEHARLRFQGNEAQEAAPDGAARPLDAATTRELKQTLQSLLEEHCAMRAEHRKLTGRLQQLEAGHPAGPHESSKHG